MGGRSLNVERGFEISIVSLVLSTERGASREERRGHCVVVRYREENSVEWVKNEYNATKPTRQRSTNQALKYQL